MGKDILKEVKKRTKKLKSFGANVGQEYFNDGVKATLKVLEDVLSKEEFKFLILSGEGSHLTEYQFAMELDNLEEAEKEYKKLKQGEYKDTWLYIYEGKMIKYS